MTARFLTPCDVRFLDEWDGWRQRRVLLAPLRFFSAILEREVIVPAGFVCDGESRPTAGFLSGPECVAAGAVHDWLCASHETDEATAGLVYQEALLAGGIDPFYADMRWRMVRDWGGRAWASGPARRRILAPDDPAPFA